MDPTIYLLYDYARYGAAHIDDSLRGPRIGGGVHEYAQPYFTAEERATMIAAVEPRIAEIGGGRFEKGKSIVIARKGRFGSNR